MLELGLEAEAELGDEGEQVGPVISMSEHGSGVPSVRLVRFAEPAHSLQIAGKQGNFAPQTRTTHGPGKAMPDHIHMLLSVPPRYSIAMTIGYLKGKSATRIHRELLHTKGTLFGRSFWARGYCVSTVGLDEDQIRRYIREQEKLQRDQDQGELNLD